jgi:class 3 adenylate cyclase/pSer/pThr/pTyr-binding forkhead associated (FHA) protein
VPEPPTLIVHAPDGTRRNVALGEAPVSVGRDPAAGVVLDDSYVSRKHVRIERVSDGYAVTDEGSRNGTFVNGTRLEGSHILATGDEMKIGGFTIVFVDPSAPEFDATMAFNPDRTATLEDAPLLAPIRCDAGTREVWIHGQRVDLALSVQEFALLRLLSSRYGQVRTRDELGNAIWGKGNFEYNMLHRLVHRLKQKLDASVPGAVVAIAGVGYKLDADAAVSGEMAGVGEHDTAIIMFSDIADSTALTERLGDAAFRERARALDALLRETVTAHDGRAIEGRLLGDGMLAVFSSARRAIEAALRIAACGDEVGLPLHVGLHAGDVIREEANVFGGAVNIAARVSGLASPGEVLVSATVRDLGRTSATVAFVDRGEHQLKGVAEAVRVWSVAPA